MDKAQSCVNSFQIQFDVRDGQRKTFLMWIEDVYICKTNTWYLLYWMLLYGTMGHYSVRNSNKQQGWPNNVRRTIQYQHTTAILRELQHFRQ